MNNTEKRQDLFNGNFMNNGVEGVLDDKFQDPKMLIVRDFHTESIHQALAEDRARVVGKIEYLCNRAEGENKMIPPQLLRNLINKNNE